MTLNYKVKDTVEMLFIHILQSIGRRWTFLIHNQDNQPQGNIM